MDGFRLLVVDCRLSIAGTGDSSDRDAAVWPLVVSFSIERGRGLGLLPCALVIRRLGHNLGFREGSLGVA